MPRRSVKFEVGDFFHVYNRGHNRDRIFFEKENYLFFLRKVREYLLIAPRESVSAAGPHAELSARVPDQLDARSETRGCCRVIAYCLMPNHYHFLVKVEAAGFSLAMQSLGQAYTNAINKKMNRVGSLFQGRFQAIQVDNEDYLLHLTRYIHLNPVEASLVNRAAEWEFSSYPEYIGIRCGSLPDPTVIMGQFDSPAKYREFVEARSRVDHPSISHLLLD